MHGFRQVYAGVGVDADAGVGVDGSVHSACAARSHSLFDLVTITLFRGRQDHNHTHAPMFILM